MHAQTREMDGGLVACAGPRRNLEVPFMELDHISPKSDRGENHTLHCYLLCCPCNGRKRDHQALRGLMLENRMSGWLKDEVMAEWARDAAKNEAEWVRDCSVTAECEDSLRPQSLPPRFASSLF